MLSWELVEGYASLLVHRTDQYAVQQQSGSYWRVTEPLCCELLLAHLHGRCTLGTYLLAPDNTCSYAVFDADSEDGREQLTRLSTDLLAQGIPTILEASRRGGHLWLFLAAPTAARLVRSWLLPYASALGVELYPKQEMLVPGGSGSLIRLPLGVHRRSRCWYPFLCQSADGEWLPVGETVEQCCRWLLRSAQRVGVPEHVQRLAIGPTHTTLVAHSWDIPTPGKGAIRAWCHSQDIVEVIGRFVSLNGQGLGSCPFKEHHVRGDVRPSFQVFGGDNQHWYCYTWGRAGDLFEFLCLYHGLSVQEAWARLQAGTLL